MRFRWISLFVAVMMITMGFSTVTGFADDENTLSQQTASPSLETIADENGLVKECEGDTGIYIYPGYKFKCLDALITNFHLPESTLLMLVSALAGKDFVMSAYKHAVDEKYRFFSFGDAMFIK